MIPLRKKRVIIDILLVQFTNKNNSENFTSLKVFRTAAKKSSTGPRYSFHQKTSTNIHVYKNCRFSFPFIIASPEYARDKIGYLKCCAFKPAKIHIKSTSISSTHETRQHCVNQAKSL